MGSIVTHHPTGRRHAGVVGVTGHAPPLVRYKNLLSRTGGGSSPADDRGGPGTGTGDFAGWTGSARIIHDEQGAYFEIDLT
jgi:hypothetical protein